MSKRLIAFSILIFCLVSFSLAAKPKLLSEKQMGKFQGAAVDLTSLSNRLSTVADNIDKIDGSRRLDSKKPKSVPTSERIDAIVDTVGTAAKIGTGVSEAQLIIGTGGCALSTALTNGRITTVDEDLQCGVDNLNSALTFNAIEDVPAIATSGLAELTDARASQSALDVKNGVKGATLYPDSQLKKAAGIFERAYNGEDLIVGIGNGVIDLNKLSVNSHHGSGSSGGNDIFTPPPPLNPPIELTLSNVTYGSGDQTFTALQDQYGNLYCGQIPPKTPGKGGGGSGSHSGSSSSSGSHSGSGSGSGSGSSSGSTFGDGSSSGASSSSFSSSFSSGVAKVSTGQSSTLTVNELKALNN